MTDEEQRDMEQKINEYKKLKWEIRKRKVKDALKEAPGKVMDVCKTHGKEIAASAPFVYYAVRKAAKVYGEHKEEVRKALEIYDYSLHRWCYLKRKMNPKEELEFKKRLRNGEKVYDILSTMRLLKY